MTTKCNQTGCENPAAFRFTWPGQDEAGVCLEHERGIRQSAEAIGCPVQMIPLTEPTDQPDPEAVRCWEELAGHYDSDYLRRPTAIISRQETHSQHIHEDAAKASGVLVDKFYGQVMDYAFRTKIQAIICDAFGAPAKDNLRKEFEKHWANLPRWINQEQKEVCFEAFKLAKGDK